ncbi:MAG: hypothetical protein IPK74_12695 [Deltaproteobacteria bacterium]|nr:hypothetical protein [Deltaproteobacteria bacterium]
MKNLDKLLEYLELCLALPADYPKLAAAFTTILQSYRSRLPTWTFEALDVAQAHWSADSSAQTEEELARAKALVWKHLTQNIASRSEQGWARALLCVLEPRTSVDDVHELVSWYGRFLMDAGLNEGEIVLCLRRSLLGDPA